ncbi:MAG: hypothetical protein D6679_14285 [Candidatus Hydrogenedentota bacterium]|nr:MAG: hypothetical protein D6679_14285 [Candidatus Hydrogenedentota bacterium]
MGGVYDTRADGKEERIGEEWENRGVSYRVGCRAGERGGEVGFVLFRRVLLLGCSAATTMKPRPPKIF